jgi:hypothetical protein
VDKLKRTLVVVLAGAALGLLIGGLAHGASPAGPAPAAAPPAAPGAEKPAAAPPVELQISGRLIHAWEEKPGLQVLLAIDGFAVLTRHEQLTARDGVVWFDKAEAQKTGKVVLGVYAETGVEYKRAGGQIEKYDSVYLTLEAAGEPSLVHEEKELRGKADNTELYLRGKKLRQEFLTRGVREQPTSVVPAPLTGSREPVPGVREAGVPQEVRILAQDDVREVTLSRTFDRDLGVWVYTWSGGVYVITPDMEMACDNLVIWTPADASKAGDETGLGSPAKPAAAKPAAAPVAEPRGLVVDEAAAKKAEAAPAPKGSRQMAVEAYLEGHVRINQKDQWLQCSQLFYDFGKNQALAINTKIHTYARNRNVPVYYYAAEVRQLARDIFVGTHARMTTCEFAEPHHELTASKMVIQELTPTAEDERENIQYRRVRFLGEDVEMRVQGLPLTWWPRLAGDVTQADTALRNIRIENRGSRGTGVATQWHLLKLLGLQNEPPGLDLYLDVDAWSKRGPATGVEGQYTRPEYFGQILSYYLPHDTGTDSFNGVDVTPPTQRGRLTWRHRQYLPNNWELTAEASHVSDPTFMNEYFQKEDMTGKAQETLLYLKRQEHERALWMLASARVEDFYTRTEYLPQIGYNVIGHSFWDDKLTYYQDSEVGVARYRPHDPNKPFDVAGTGQQGIPPANSELASPETLVFDSLHEVDLPLKAGVVNVVPFVSGRLSYFSNTVAGGGTGRVEAKEGVRLSTRAWKVYNDVESEFWDVHRLRHLNLFDVTAYASQVNVHSRELYPFSPTEDGTQTVTGVDGQGVVQLGWRQRFQTQRGKPNAEGKQQSVDFFTTDLETTFYSNRTRPNIGPDTGPEFNNIDFRTHWRTTDTTSLWTDTLYNLDASRLEKFDIGLLVTHTPRISYSVGQRVIPEGNSSITFFGVDYQISEKWRVSVLEQFDWARGTNAHSEVILTRRLHRWLLRLKFSHDPSGNKSFVGVELQPLGVNEVKVSW